MVQQGRSRSKIAEVKKKYKKKEYSECTYQPKINKSSKKKTPYRKNITNRIDEILEQRERKRENLKKRQMLNKEKDLMENCTFAPKINRQGNIKNNGDKNVTVKRRTFMEKESFCLEIEEECQERRPLPNRGKSSFSRRKSLIPQTSRIRKKKNKQSFSPLNIKPQRSMSALRKSKSRARYSPNDLQFKNPTKLMLKAKKKKKTKKPIDPGIFTKRTIVVLNENDEFEDLNSYLEKKRKEQNESKSRSEKEIGGNYSQPRLFKEHKDAVEPIVTNVEEIQIHDESMISRNIQKRKEKREKKKISNGTNRNKLNEKFNQNRRLSIELIDKENQFQGNYLEKHTLPILDDEIEFDYTETNTVCELSKLKLSVIESPKKSNYEESKLYNQNGREFLVINGEKIFFNEETISSIIDTSRIKKLAQCFGHYK